MRVKPMEIPKHTWRAKIETVASEMAHIFGAQNVVVRSEYHLQVLHGGRQHDIWVRVDNAVRFQSHGTKAPRRSQWARSAADLAHAIEQAGNSKPVAATIKEALDLASLVRWASRHLPDGETELMFCDAGVSGKAAQAAAVWVGRSECGIDTAARTMCLHGVTIDEAEYRAVALGIAVLHSMDRLDCMILTDSMSAVQRCHKEGVYQVQWLGREHNKLADSLANLRKR